MKKFFRSKEAGTITPLPPSSPATSTSSFSTPRPFDEYQARVASQSEPNRPLSYQAPSAPSRSHVPPDQPGFSQPHPSSQRRSQQYGQSDPPLIYSPNKNRFSVTSLPSHSAQAPYESYSDPISEHPQPYRSSNDRHVSRHQQPRSVETPQSGSKRSSQQLPSGIAILSPPRSQLVAAPSSPRRHPNPSIPVGVPPDAAYHSQLEPLRLSTSDRGIHDPARASHPMTEDNEDNVDTPVASRSRRSAAYPVYSGANGDQDDGEVLISQGRYEETVLSDVKAKDQAKAKKLFGFTAGGKDKKAKHERERDRNATPSPSPSSGRDRDAAGRLSPPIDSHLLSGNERAKDGGWMGKWNKLANQQQATRIHDKEAEEFVMSRIGWLSGSANSEQDWMQILPLIDVICQSEAASKEAARALRREFKYGSVDTQRRAVRIWALLTLNSSDRFRLQIASKRFLDAVEDTIASSKTPLRVKETMLRVLGVLAFEFKSNPELASVTKCWNKIRPNDRRKDGEPLEDDLSEFRLPQPRPSSNTFSQPVSRRSSQQRPHPGHTSHTEHHQVFATGFDPAIQRAASPGSAPVPHSWQQQHYAGHPASQPGPEAELYSSAPRVSTDHAQNGRSSDVVSHLEAAAQSMVRRSASIHSSVQSHEPITHEEDVRRLHEECNVARSNASVLTETLVHQGLGSHTAALVEEFYEKVTHSQGLIGSQIPWASAQADRSRTNGAGRETREEALLADLLEAHGRASEALHMVDDARRRMDEEEEGRQALKRSKVEVRLDRSALAQDVRTGELYDLNPTRGSGLLGVEREAQASGSRSPSPAHAMLPAVLTPGLNGSSRISRPLPVPRSEPSSDTNLNRSAFHNYHSTASRASLNQSVGSETRTHSRDASVSSQLGPPVQSGLSTSPGRSLPLTPNLNVNVTKAESTEGRREEDDDDDDDDLQTPIVPSAKALGKRRAMSVRYPTPPPQSAPVVPAQSTGLVNGINGIHIA